MRERHRLLQRQLKRHQCDPAKLSEECIQMMEAVNDAYWESDEDREMLERALELSSQELLQANSKMRAVIQSFPDVFLRTDEQGLVVNCVGDFDKDLYPWTENSVGKVLYDIFGDSAAIRLRTAVDLVIQKKIRTNIEFQMESDKDQRHYEARLLPLLGSQILIIIRDISERKQAEEQLIYFSMFDPLTGLYNRAYFEKEMHRLQNDFFNPVGMIICDVDNLKMVNDTNGHERGDVLLIEVARVLQQSLRRHDVIARIGGDEFAVLLPNSDKTAVESTCYRIRRALKDYNFNNPTFPLSISMGYSVRNHDEVRMDEIFKEADDNMYKEKFIHHRSFSGSQIQTIFDTPGSANFVIRGRWEKVGKHRRDLAISIEDDRQGTDSLDMTVHIDKCEENGSQDIFSTEPEIRSSGNPGKDKKFLRSLINILNIAIDSLPPEKTDA